MWLFGALAAKSGYIIAFLLIALVLAVFLLPQIRQSVLKFPGSLTHLPASSVIAS